MKFVLEIDCENDAFVKNQSNEISRILHDLAHRLTAVGVPLDGLERIILDADGNPCGWHNMLND